MLDFQGTARLRARDSGSMNFPSKQLHLPDSELTRLVMDPVSFEVVQQAIYPDRPCVRVEGFS